MLDGALVGLCWFGRNIIGISSPPCRYDGFLGAKAEKDLQQKGMIYLIRYGYSAPAGMDSFIEAVGTRATSPPRRGAVRGAVGGRTILWRRCSIDCRRHVTRTNTPLVEVVEWDVDGS